MPPQHPVPLLLAPLTPPLPPSSFLSNAPPPTSQSNPFSDTFNPSMDIRKLVNGRAAQAQPMDGHTECQWHHHQTLPPVSSILPDHAYAAGHHYPIPPQGEGPVYYQQAYQQQPQPHHMAHQQSYFVQQPQQQQQQQQYPAPPSYQPQELPYLITSQSARGSSSTVSSTRYAASVGSGPATSAERRSLSEGEDDDESDESGENTSGGSTPLPPYFASQEHQQVCFTDVGAVVSPSSSSPRSTVEGGNEFVCEVCSVSYSRAPDLRRHKASVHNDRDSREKVSATFPCDVCGQVLLSSHGYQGHMRRHYDERPFVCESPFCGKAFHDSATLARHRRTHSTEHKFECDFCGRRFKRKDNLNTHRKKHQVGGETINPNLLRKPVSRVGGSGDSPPGGTPQSQGYPELPGVASPPYQQQIPMSSPTAALPVYSPIPISPISPLQQQHDLRRPIPQQPHQAMYTQAQQQQQVSLHYPLQVQAPPYQQQAPQPISIAPLAHPQAQQPYLYQQHQQQHPHVRSNYVKAEEIAAMENANGTMRARVYAVAAPRH